MVLGPRKGQDPLPRGCGPRVHVTGHRSGPDERDGIDLRLGEDRVDGGPPAVDEVDDARREPRLRRKADEVVGRERDALRRFQDERVPERDRRGEHPEGDHDGEVERGDPRDHPDRLREHLGVDAARDVRERRAGQEGGDPLGELGRFDPPPDRAPRVVERLPVLGDREAGEELAVALQEGPESADHPTPLADRGRRPPGNATRAAWAAAATSLGPESGTVASTSPVAGLTTGSESAVSGSRSRPPTKLRNRRGSAIRAAMWFRGYGGSPGGRGRTQTPGVSRGEPTAGDVRAARPADGYIIPPSVRPPSMRYVKLNQSELHRVKELYEGVMSHACHGLFFKEGSVLGADMADEALKDRAKYFVRRGRDPEGAGVARRDPLQGRGSDREGVDRGLPERHSHMPPAAGHPPRVLRTF